MADGFKIGDLAGLSAPITRLIEVIAEGFGALHKPSLVKQVANADAQRILTVSSAIDEAYKKHDSLVTYKNGEIEIKIREKREGLALINTEDVQENAEVIIEQERKGHSEREVLVSGNTEISQRATDRLLYQEERRQENLESITSLAMNHLFNEDAVPQEKPDPDWTTRFFNNAQDVSSEEMQDIWARILAGEVKKPGSYSLRTLEFMKNMTKREAEIFSKAARLGYAVGGGNWVVFSHDTNWLETNKQITYSDRLILIELGILTSLEVQYKAFNDDPIQSSFHSQDNVIIVRRESPSGIVNIPIWKFSEIGNEMINLVTRSLDNDYIDYLAKPFTSHGGTVTVGRILEKLEDGSLSYRTLRTIEPPSISQTQQSS